MQENQENVAFWKASEETISRRREKSVVSSAAKVSGKMNTEI